MNLDPVLIAVPFFFVTMGVEFLLLRGRADVKGYTLVDTVGSLTQGAGYLLSNSLWRLVVLAGFGWLSQFSLFTIESGWAAFLVLIVLDDFLFYWFHRFGHEVHIGWAAHHTHHSSQHYNLSTALRQSWTEQLYHPLFGIPLVLLGFPLELMAMGWAFSLIYQYWLHTEMIGKLGWFGKVFNTPSHHRVHHGANPEYLDRNYAGVFVVWDRLFGTFVPEVAPVVYGTTTGFDRQQPLVVAFHEHGMMFGQALRAKTWRGRVGALLRPPGWTAAG